MPILNIKTALVALTVIATLGTTVAEIKTEELSAAKSKLATVQTKVDILKDNEAKLKEIINTLEKNGEEKIQKLTTELNLEATFPPTNEKKSKYDNLALFKPAKVSSILEDKSSYRADQAVDGDMSTRWISMTNHKTGWLEVDFGKETSFNIVNIDEFYTDQPSITSFIIQYWNGGQWLDAYVGKTIGENFNTQFELVTGSKVRLNITSSTQEPSIKEFSVYNTTAKPDRTLPENVLLEFEAKKSFDFFWNEANTDKDSPGYGLIRDRAPGNPNTSSIASVGFGLSALAIGVERGWVSREKAEERTLGTLKTLLNNASQENGFFYHFLEMQTGKRAQPPNELSSVDTALALNGVITVGEYFGGEVKNLADQIYDRVDWVWFRNPENNQFYMAWSPEDGFESQTWDWYAEQLSMYILGAGSSTHPIDKSMFYSFRREKGAYKGGESFIYSFFGSIFTYQFSHAWVDFRNKTDEQGVNWWNNSLAATRASRQFSIDHAHKYKTFGEHSWGLTASDGPNGYKGEYGSPPVRMDGNNDQYVTDGTIPPAGAAGSIVFAPKEVIDTLKNYYENYPNLWGKYGFKDAYNLDINPNWYAQDVIGIDKGITLLMIENYRSGFVWKYFMKNEAVQRGINTIGLKYEK